MPVSGWKDVRCVAPPPPGVVLLLLAWEKGKGVGGGKEASRHRILLQVASPVTACVTQNGKDGKGCDSHAAVRCIYILYPVG